ncbi:MAG: hypothetical protein SYR96_35300, partial [Actinomycetota bacterium]|nr:hypothetical protein [Actinomycetota bacterium]
MSTRNRLLPMAVAALVGVALTGAGCARHSNRPGPAAAPVAGGDYYNYQAVWTGAHVLIHQPDYSTGRGTIDAAFDPATGHWRR